MDRKTKQWMKQADYDMSTASYMFKRIDLLSEVIYEIFEPIEAFSFTPNEWETSDFGTNRGRPRR